VSSSITGDVSSYFDSIGLGNLFITGAIAGAILVFVILWAKEVKAKRNIEIKRYRDNAKLDEAVNAYKIGYIRKAATAKGFNLSDEIKAMTEDDFIVGLEEDVKMRISN
jgi:hypothetical protein